MIRITILKQLTRQYDGGGGMDPIIKLIEKISVEDLAKATLQIKLWGKRNACETINKEQLKSELMVLLPPAIIAFIKASNLQEKEIIEQLAAEKIKDCDIDIDKVLDKISRNMSIPAKWHSFSATAKVFYLVDILSQALGNADEDWVNKNLVAPLQKIALIMLFKQQEIDGTQKRLQQHNEILKKNIARSIPNHEKKLNDLKDLAKKISQRKKAIAEIEDVNHELSIKMQLELQELQEKKKLLRAKLTAKEREKNINKMISATEKMNNKIIKEEDAKLNAEQTKLAEALAPLELRYVKKLIDVLVYSTRIFADVLTERFLKILQDNKPGLAADARVSPARFVHNEMQCLPLRMIEMIVFPDLKNDKKTQIYNFLAQDSATKLALQQYAMLYQLLFLLSQKSANDLGKNLTILAEFQQQLIANAELFRNAPLYINQATQLLNTIGDMQTLEKKYYADFGSLKNLGHTSIWHNARLANSNNAQEVKVLPVMMSRLF